MKHLTITGTVLKRALIVLQKTALGFVFCVLGASGSSLPAMRWLVAPVVVGEQATLGAGTVLVSNAPEHQLTLSRSSQTTIESWVRPSDRSVKEKK